MHDRQSSSVWKISFQRLDGKNVDGSVFYAAVSGLAFGKKGVFLSPSRAWGTCQNALLPSIVLISYKSSNRWPVGLWFQSWPFSNLVPKLQTFATGTLRWNCLESGVGTVSTTPSRAKLNGRKALFQVRPRL